MLPIINSKDIKEAERILFGKTGVFDRERVDYIKNLGTIDLQAVPGSGKTTALLAKLLILEKYLPLDNESGVLVLSHTNTAIEEIKEKIGEYCPKLFGYPNYIGTIQSFVDHFLAIPYFRNIIKTSHFRIDNEIYNERLEFELKMCLTGHPWNIYKKVLHIYRSNPELIYKYRLGFNEAKKAVLKKGIDGELLEIKKPKGNTSAANYCDYTEDEKEAVRDYLHKLKKKILQSGVLCFDDAYFLAELYMIKVPQIKKVIQNRFKLAFVDEMQDMDTHQYRLLDELFYIKKVRNHVFQRIGDKNQAIYSSSSNSTDVWSDREKVLKFNGSQRLSPQIADVVKYFGTNFLDIEGRNNDLNISPILIRFSNGMEDKVLEKFTEIIKKYKDDFNIENLEERPIKAIGWSTSNNDINKLGIEDYFGAYKKSFKKKKIDFMNLKSYIDILDKSSGQFKPIREVFINSFLKILRLEKIMLEERSFSKHRLLNHVKENFPNSYEEFNIKIYNWSLALINEDDTDIHLECSTYFRQLLTTIFNKPDLSELTEAFINDNIEQDIDPEDQVEINEINCFEANEVKVQVGTIHSVKGETHFATLYMETCYYKHESEKSKNQLLQKQVIKRDKKTTKEAAKMMYVGFSRPTTILAYAASRIRISDEMKAEMITKGWKVEDIN